MQIARFGVSWRNNVAILAIDGEIDVSNASEFCDRYLVLAKQGPAVIVDLTACRYMDSSGLQVLAKSVGEKDAPRAIVVPPKSPVRRIFDVLNLARVLTVVETLHEALAIDGTQPPGKRPRKNLKDAIVSAEDALIDSMTKRDRLENGEPA